MPLSGAEEAHAPAQLEVQEASEADTPTRFVAADPERTRVVSPLSEPPTCVGRRVSPPSALRPPNGLSSSRLRTLVGDTSYGHVVPITATNGSMSANVTVPLLLQSAFSHGQLGWCLVPRRLARQRLHERIDVRERHPPVAVHVAVTDRRPQSAPSASAPVTYRPPGRADSRRIR